MTRRQRPLMETTTVRLPAERIQALDQLGARLDRSRNYLIRKAVEAYLEDHATEPVEANP